MKFRIDNFAETGMIADLAGWQLPPSGWTTLSNVRIDDRQVGTIDGYSEFCAATGAAPYYLISAADDDTYRLIYPSLTSIRMTTDGSSTIDVTGTTTPSGNANNRWNGGVLNGLPVLNNGKEVPQYLADLGGTTNFADLTGWVSTERAKVVRPFRNFLFALNVSTDSGSNFDEPFYLKWSTSADTGGIPSSWTAATTNDAGDAYLAETKGALVDAIPLGDQLMIYKDDSAYICQYIGGDAVFRFARARTLSGMLSQDCGCEFQGGHFVLAKGDIYVTDGQQKTSVAVDRVKDAIINSIDSNSYDKTFVYHSIAHKEIWICYPQAGANKTLPDSAWIWDYDSNTWSHRSLPSNTTFIASGVVTATTRTWSNLPWSTWENWEGGWGTPRYSPIEEYPIAACTDSKLYQFGSGNQANGTNQVVVMEKKALNLGDNDAIQRITTLYPTAEGGMFDVYVGTQMYPNDTVTYEGPYTFTPGSDHKIDVRSTGRYHALKFTSESNVRWSISGIEIEYKQAGKR